MKIQNHPTRPQDYVILFLKGIAMGTADIIPGVSGGTMAFITGIYEDLLDSIRSFDMTLVRLLLRRKIQEAVEYVPWQFLATLFFGIGVAFVGLAHGVDWMLQNERIYLFAFFFGLILASIVAIGGMVRWSAGSVGMLVLGTVVAYVVVGLVPLEMPHDPLTMLFSGMIAIMAMILPGISGSFLLLILGQYDYVLQLVKSLDVVGIFPLAVGAVIGLMGFSRVLSWLLKRYHQATVAALIGFMIGSLRKIWPWKEVIETRIDRHGDIIPIVEKNILPVFGSTEFAIAVVLCIVGFLVVSYIDHLQSRSNPVLRLFLK
jgi:putative membrane protein